MGRVRWPWWSGAAGSAALILVPTVLTFVFVYAAPAAPPRAPPELGLELDLNMRAGAA